MAPVLGAVSVAGAAVLLLDSPLFAAGLLLGPLCGAAAVLTGTRGARPVRGTGSGPHLARPRHPARLARLGILLGCLGVLAWVLWLARIVVLFA
ncbi:hypothetical protein [Streptomyces sp. NPDC097619]|uniref:hypothetical protein n=1 Tax=Streptomyces sp. NPDC097619 TaxID=3157228 RepID=UPI00332532A5